MTLRYIAWRLAQVVPTVAGILLVGFLLINIAPGDPILALAGESGDEAYYAFMREKFGLDRPLHVRLGSYIGNVARGDLGISYTHGRPAAEVIAERVPATVLLAAASLLISSFGGVAIGVVAVVRSRGFEDLAINVGTLGLYATPVFWVAQLSLLAFGLGLGWFPVQGMTTAGGAHTGLGHLMDVGRHLVLPALVLASQEVAAVARLTRSGLMEEMTRDHITTARAKGLPERLVLVRHGLRRALLPVVTVIGSRVGHLLSGAVVVEVVFGWPGLGRLLLTAMQTRNSPILLGIFFLVAFSVVLANLVTDLAYAWLDPRIRYG